MADTPAHTYLDVDRFLETIVDARALATAFDLGLIDAVADGPATRAALATRLGIEASGLDLLLDLLAASGVIADDAGARAPETVRLSERFEATLRYRELLEAKLDLLLSVAVPDLLLGFTDLVTDVPRFMTRSRMFQLFDYQRATELAPGNEEWTQRWVRFTTALTAHEAAACLERHDFSGYRRLLDVGGNSGEFAVRICAAHPHLSATILDLPVVCRIGEAHVGRTVEGSRIRFLAGDARRDDWPEGMDVVTFKSMLHDWPDEETTVLLARARRALRPGGTLLIFERTKMELRSRPLPCSLVPMLLFARSFRDPDWYQSRLEEAGFTRIKTQRFALDTPFMLVAGIA